MFDTSINLDELNKRGSRGIAGILDIKFTEIGTDYLLAQMPVNENTHQPFGILHGGVSAVLAETVGSTAGYLLIDKDKYYCVGLEIKCNHIRSKRSGIIFGKASPVHIGRKTHVWKIEIYDEYNKIICFSILTLAIISIEEIKSV